MQKKRLPQSVRAQRGRRPATAPLESLERRQLLSAAFLEEGGRLVVRGTSGNDNITVGVNPSDKSQVHVVVNGQSFNFSDKFVEQVKVEAGRGNALVKSDTSAGQVGASMFFL